ncbi:MAG: hypothetical protein UR66_C0009G0149 [Candidatus Moranbacteria bacterium GW2011_GWE1_35_17]|nr:MAG: hypothetical protein UR66_C0009G0149 [Candidatus Moranbacteria bacterium GW2011_GWE1_35_17]KKP73004.1 MAG: hypothetical protein UR65_C0009G0008 [Candidatus Moranbacteria bacterium GW2011_GWE2_35_164]KKP84724.1 MAG: hypothetical protein UR83_C0014G0027 [Candidatus Moranbacteria bacterium GW2011_GWF2_35_54]HBR79301.1 hypothetical protein [Candidatus Moranbacteria bacterium]
MKKNNSFFQKNKTYLIIGILLIIWICFFIFIISPSVGLLKDDFDSVQMKLIDGKNNDDKLSKLDNLKNNFEKVASEKDNLNVIFSKDNIVGLVEELELIAQKTGNDITISVDEGNKKILEPNKGKPNSQENEILKLSPVKDYFAIKIILAGDYNGLAKFIDKLDNIKYYNSVVSFKIESKKIILEKETDNKKSNPNGGISVLGDGNGADLSEEEKEKLVLNSELDVIFYSLEKNDGKK